MLDNVKCKATNILILASLFAGQLPVLTLDHFDKMTPHFDVKQKMVI